MPIYEYACPTCGHEFEQIVKVSAPPPPCPDCASDKVDKKISLAAFHLKGGGWYSDAYAGADNKKPGTASSTSESSSTSKSSDSSTSSSSTTTSTDSSSTPAKSSSSSASSTD